MDRIEDRQMIKKVTQLAIDWFDLSKEYFESR